MTVTPTRRLLTNLDLIGAEMMKPSRDVDLVIDSLVELVFARLGRREEHLQALILLGRALQVRNVGNDVAVALERLEQAMNLAVEIGASQLIKNAGWALATAYAHAGEFLVADGTLARLALVVLKGRRPPEEDVRWMERLTLKVQSIVDKSA